jgi:hypothetical protein
MAATTALNILPSDTQKLSDEIHSFQVEEEKKLSSVFEYVAQLNRERTAACTEISKSKVDHNRNLNPPKKPQQQEGGIFDTDAMGQEAVDFALRCAPAGYSTLATFEVHDEVFASCLQGESVGKAFFLWAQQLQWPTKYIWRP